MKKSITKGSAVSDESIFVNVFKKFYFSSLLAIVCGCVGQIFGNIVVGNRLGEDKLAVMSLVLPVYYIFATIGNLAGIGGSALCANLIGKRETENCKKAFCVTYVFTVILCLFFSVLVLVFLPQIVNLLGGSKDLEHDVSMYCGIMSAGGIFTACVYLSFNFLRLDGKSAATTLTFVIMAAINVIFDIALASFGVAGIAVANIAGSAAATLFGVILISKKSRLLGFTRVTFKEIISYSAKILAVGSPGATENVSILLKSYFLNQIITAAINAAALSRLSVVNSINSFSLAITVGSAGALVPIIGVFSAERDTVSIRRTLKSALKLSGVFLAVFIVIIVVFAPSVAKLFGIVDGIDNAVLAIRLFSISLPFALLSNILIYLHLANGHTVISNVLTALKYFVFAVAIAFYFMKLWDETGLWLSFAACEIAALLAAAVMHFVTKLRNKDLSPVLLLDTRFEKNGKSVAVTTKDDDESLSEAVAAIGDFCEQNSLSSKLSMMLTLSMDEMLHMAAEHSTRSGENNIISIRVIILDKIIVQRLRYVGEMFNPIEYFESKKTDSNDIDAMLELADCLGMKMVTDICDVVDYRTTFGINNLTIISEEKQKNKTEKPE